MNIFNEAIEKHAQWKMILKRHIEEGAYQEIKEVADCHFCDLGHWIYGDGVRYNRLHSFDAMCIAHEQFHRAAAEVVLYSNANEKEKARDLMRPEGTFFKCSSNLTKALMQCSKDLADSLQRGIGVKNKLKIKSLLESKKSDTLFSIESPASVWDAIKMMVDNNIGSLAVTKEGKFLGIFSERGYFQNMVFKGGPSLDTPVSEMLDMNSIAVDLEDSVEQCMILMTSTHTRHLPVIDNDTLVGMVSIGDVIKQIVSSDSDKISQLENYVHGHYGF